MKLQYANHNEALAAVKMYNSQAGFEVAFLQVNNVVLISDSWLKFREMQRVSNEGY